MATALPGLAQTDSVEVGLITCSPHEEVYSLYGHSALRWHNLSTGEDLVFNYGIFNFQKPHFVLRFVFGLTDYELGATPTRPFLDYYRKWGSSVTEQVLNLTEAEKQRIGTALAINLRPENKTYRYNYFYDNCSTRPRDVVEQGLEGTVGYAPHEGECPTWRQMTDALTQHHPWARFGNNMLLGAKADTRASQRQQQFLPGRLMADFEHAVIMRPGQNVVPLVLETRLLVEPGVQTVAGGFPLTPMQCALALLLLSAVLFAVEWRRGRTLVWWDVLLMLLTGLSGCIILTMFFSQHPCTSTNLIIFLLNPLPLFFIPAALRRRRRTLRRFCYAGLAGIALFFAGALWQDYPEGMEILALCLLIRICSHFRNDQ